MLIHLSSDSTRQAAQSIGTRHVASILRPRSDTNSAVPNAMRLCELFSVSPDDISSEGMGLSSRAMVRRGGTRDVTYSGDCLADNARQAYENIDGTGRASIEAYLQERDLSMYGHDNYNDTDIEFLGMRVDPDEEHPDGYSRKAWERYIVDNPDEHM